MLALVRKEVVEGVETFHMSEGSEGVAGELRLQ